MQKKGWIEVICGSMFSGKSEELIRRIKRAQIARQKFQVFKPAIDVRYSVVEVVSHNGIKIEAVPVEESMEIFERIDEDTEVVGIDEVQFFDSEIVDVCQELADRGKRVIIAGLDQDFRGESFGQMPHLLAIAEKIEKLQAICTVCGEPASRTGRFIDGKAAGYEDQTIMLGSKEVYEARCRACHEIPGHPRKNKAWGKEEETEQLSAEESCQKN